MVRITKVALNTKAFKLLADASAKLKGQTNMQLTGVGSGLLYFIGRGGFIKLEFLPTRDPLLYLSVEQLQNIESIIPSLEFIANNIREPMGGLRNAIVERMMLLREEDIFLPEDVTEPMPVEQEDLGFSENPKVSEMLHWLRELIDFEGHQRPIENLEFTGAIDRIVAQYNLGSLQFTERIKEENYGKRTFHFVNLWSVPANGLSIGTLEQAIQEWISKLPDQWDAQQRVVYFLQKLANVKRPMVLPKR